MCITGVLVCCVDYTLKYVHIKKLYIVTIHICALLIGELVKDQATLDKNAGWKKRVAVAAGFKK